MISGKAFLNRHGDRAMTMRKTMSCPAKIGNACKFLDVRRASDPDISSSVALMKEAFPHMDIVKPFWKFKLGLDDTIVIALNGEKIIGTVNVATRDKEASIDTIAVDPGFQGKGIGSMLMDEAEDVARSRGKNVVNLMTEQVKPQNVAFYSKRGYKVTGFLPHGYSHGPAVSLQKRF